MPLTSEGCSQTKRSVPVAVVGLGMSNPFRYFSSSPEVIVVVMMYVRCPLFVENLLAKREIDISPATVRF